VNLGKLRVAGPKLPNELWPGRGEIDALVGIALEIVELDEVVVEPNHELVRPSDHRPLLGLVDHQRPIDRRL
jgi:hypothetical protein